MEDMLIAWGGEIKALGNGKVGGYLLRYTGPDAPDLEGDYFTADTDFDIEAKSAVSVYYHHGQDPTLKNRRLGRASVRPDDVGLWVEAQLNLRDEYETAVYGMVQAGKVGWSSGSVAHLVTRAKVGNAHHIKSWPIAEASITPTPAAGPTLTSVLPLKSLLGAGAQDTPALSAQDTDDAAQDTAPDQANGGDEINPITESEKMAEQETKAAEAKAVDTDAILAAVNGLAQNLKAISGEVEALKAQPVEGVKTSTTKAPAVVNRRGDDFGQTFMQWVRGNTHELGGSDGRTLELTGSSNDSYKMSKLAQKLYLQHGGRSAMKASNDTDMNVGTDADGGYTVPTGLHDSIIRRRDEQMLANRLGVRPIFGAGTTVNVALDGEADGEFVSTAEAGSFDRDAPTIGQKAFTLVKYTKTFDISYELLEDGVEGEAGLLAFLADFYGRGMAKTHNNLLLTEVGSNGTNFDTAASATVWAVGEIENMVSNDDLAEYLSDDMSVGWVMRHSVLWEIRSLLSANTRNYWHADAADIPGGGLLGYPVYTSQKAGATAASATSLYFGNWRYVGVRNPSQLTVIRDPYTGAASGQLKLHCHFRTVYGVLQAEAIGYGDHPSA